MQVGEYELTFTDVVLFMVMLVALKKIVKWALAAKVNQPKAYQLDSLEKQDMTIEKVRQMRQEEGRCLAVVKDKIYDLSSSQDLYENNREMFEAKSGCTDEWEPILARKYPYIGKIVKN